jgi:hypothetical protein
VVAVLASLLHSLVPRPIASLHLEILALRHQLPVVHRARRPRLPLTPADGIVGVALAGVARLASGAASGKTRDCLGWHRRVFRLFWTWKSRRRTGRPAVPKELRALIRELSSAKPLWRAPRIHDALQKLGVSVSQPTVAKYMSRHRTSPSPLWRTFLANHADQIMPADFFVVPTVTFRLLFVLVVLAHDRRRIVPVAVTAHPTARVHRPAAAERLS